MADALDLGSSTSVCGFKSHLPYHGAVSLRQPLFIFQKGETRTYLWKTIISTNL